MHKHILDVKHKRNYEADITEVRKLNVRGVRLDFDGKIKSFLETLGPPPIEYEAPQVAVASMQTTFNIALTKEHVESLRRGNVIPVVQEILRQVEAQ